MTVPDATVPDATVPDATGPGVAGASLSSSDAAAPMAADPGRVTQVLDSAPPEHRGAKEPPGPPVPRTRAGTLWVALGAGLVILVVVLVFIVENLHVVGVTFFGAHWRAPLALDLLLSAVLGAAVVLVFGAVRIVQLRRVARRHHRARADVSSSSSRCHGPGSPSTPAT